MIYADSSFLIATRVRRDTHYESALGFYEANQDAGWLWCPWHRVEIFNSIRQLVQHPDKNRRLASLEARAIIHHIEMDVRLGYFMHMEADWRDVCRTANEISIAYAFEGPCRAADLFHVAWAKELAAETFVSFDKDQSDLAAAAGLKTIAL